MKTLTLILCFLPATVFADEWRDVTDRYLESDYRQYLGTLSTEELLAESRDIVSRLGGQVDQPDLSDNHSYAAHHAAAQRTGRLVVLVSANYCYACRTQKAALNAVGEPYAILDVGSPEARRMLGGDRSIPQTIVYERRGGKWTSRTLRGSWDVGRVREFLAGESPMKQSSHGSEVPVTLAGSCATCGPAGGLSFRRNRLFCWRCR